VQGADGKTQLVTYTREIPEHPDMLNLLKPYQDKGRLQLLVPVGSADAKLEATGRWCATSPLRWAFLWAGP